MSTRNVAIATLALTTLAGGGIAWVQYQELSALRDTAASADNPAELRKRLTALEKANRDLQDELALARAQKDDEAAMAVTEAATERPVAAAEPMAPGEGRGRGGRQAAMRDLMNNPEVQALLTSTQKAALDGRYGTLFRLLNLDPENADKLKGLLIERQNAVQDVFAAAREQGLNPREDRDAFQKLLEDARGNVNANIKSLLGESGFNQLAQYEHTMPQRELVNSLQQRLAYSDAPLTSFQSEQLVQILASAAENRAANAGGGNADGNFRGGRIAFAGGGLATAFGGGGGGGGGVPFNNVPITKDAVTQASTVLSTPQLSVLQQMQQQQQNARQLQRAIRNAMQGNANAGRAAPAPKNPKG